MDDISKDLIMNEFNYADKAREAVSLADKHLTNIDGIFVTHRTGDGNLSEKKILDDLGDFAPFFHFAGRDDIVKRHFDFIESHPESLEFKRAFEYGDLLFGLIWYGRIGQFREESQDLAANLSENAIEYFFKGKIGSYRDYGFKIKLFNTLDSTFIEVFTELYRDRKLDKYLELAWKVFDVCVSNPFFKRYGLLPEVISNSVPTELLKPFYPEKFESITMMKNNTSFGFSLLDLWRVTKNRKAKECFMKLFDGIKTMAIKGGVCNHPHIKDCRPELLSSFATLDLFCDAHVLFEDSKFLESAQEIADYWLEKQSVKTGLFPKTSNQINSYLDSETDMIVALSKLYEITKNDKYKHSALKALNGILKYHKADKGYVLEVNINNGEIIDPTLKTKFNLLLLKPLIYYSENKRIYEDENLFMLMKDR